MIRAPFFFPFPFCSVCTSQQSLWASLKGKWQLDWPLPPHHVLERELVGRMQEPLNKLSCFLPQLLIHRGQSCLHAENNLLAKTWLCSRAGIFFCPSCIWTCSGSLPSYSDVSKRSSQIVVPFLLSFSDRVIGIYLHPLLCHTFALATVWPSWGKEGKYHL